MRSYKCVDCGKYYCVKALAEECSYRHRIDEAFKKINKPKHEEKT